MFKSGIRWVSLPRNRVNINGFVDEIKTLARGQALDLHWTFNKSRPTLNEYCIMVDHKTGGFFRLILRALCSLTNTEVDPDLEHLITLIGRYYQIRDDYQNLASDEVRFPTQIALQD